MPPAADSSPPLTVSSRAGRFAAHRPHGSA